MNFSTPLPSNELCVLCLNAEGTSREHAAKKSDIKATFGKIAQTAPKFITEGSTPSRQLNSSRDIGVLFRKKICESCNTNVSQPYDKAWEELSRKMRMVVNGKLADGSNSFSGINSQLTSTEQIAVKLYFVKYFLCLVSDQDGVVLDQNLVKGLREAFLSGKATPLLYLQWCDTKKVAIAAKRLDYAVDKRNGEKTWIAFYQPGFQMTIAVCVPENIGSTELSVPFLESLLLTPKSVSHPPR